MNTNFVIVVDYDENNPYLEDQYLLGWNRFLDDACDYETTGDEIIMDDGTIAQNEFGFIDVGFHTMIYASEDNNSKNLTDSYESAKLEGIGCTICRIVLNNEGQWTVVPV